MKSRITRLIVAFLMIFLVGCAEVRDNPDTPYNEEKIMEIQSETNETELSEDFSEVIEVEEPIMVESVEESTVENTAETTVEPKDNSEVVTDVAETGGDADDGEKEDDEALPPTEEPEKNICILSVRCDTILENIDKLKKEKIPLIPSDGVIYAECEVEFALGESVFDVLLREMQRNKIHMEFNETPAYKTAYIEGINNLYEFDCGELSGWIYRVNGEIQSKGCSKCILQNGDRIEWIYTCDFGRDLVD